MTKHHNDTFLEQYVQIPDSEEEMEIRLGYSEGGINYFNYENEKRGFWLHMTPVKRTHERGYKCVSRTLMDDRGRKILVEEAKRRNQKTGRSLADALEYSVDEIAHAAIAQDWTSVAAIVQRDTTTVSCAAE